MRLGKLLSLRRRQALTTCTLLILLVLLFDKLDELVDEPLVLQPEHLGADALVGEQTDL
jgi:hypothetical protein